MHPDDMTLGTLREIANRHGTPTYAFDVRGMRNQVNRLRDALPDEVDVYYSLKANASLGVAEVFSAAGIGADVASAGELVTAIAAGFPADKIFVAGPFKLPETISQLRAVPAAIVSVDSLSELEWLSENGLANSVVLRLRPDFGSCAVVKAGSESRFGLTSDDFVRCREFLTRCDLNVIGFHVFAGSQVLDTEKLIGHLRSSMDLSLRAADELGIEPEFLNLGGGFGVPYGPQDEDIRLTQIGDELQTLVERSAPARVVLELGRFLVAQSGYYLTSVIGHQTFQGRPAVVVDGGVHQRADMCGLNLRTNQEPPLVFSSEKTPEKSATASVQATDILGCLSLPDDVMLEASPLPSLSRGDTLAFANAGAYGLWSSPALFHGSPLPAEVAFDGQEIYLMRERQAAQSILDDQRTIFQNQDAAQA
jgi:diaminopimelate decarboxylase